jgi:hypothetical protein
MAKNKSIGGIFATLSLNDAKFKKGLKSANASLGAFGTNALKVGGVASAAIVAGMTAGVKSTMSLGGQLSDLSAQTGVAVSDLMVLQQAYANNGKSADSAAKDINKMQKELVKAAKDPGGANNPFAEIGLSAEELMKMNPSEQFFAIGEAIKQIQDPAKQAAASMAIFGKSGGQLLTVFKGSSLAEVNRQLGKMPQVMEKFADRLDAADDALGRLPIKSKQFFTGFTAGVIDEILPALGMVDNYDFTSLGQRLGDELGQTITATMDLLNSGEWWNLFVLEAELAFAKILELPVVRQLAELIAFAAGGDLNEINQFLGGGYAKEVERQIAAIQDAIPVSDQASFTPDGKPREIPEIEIPAEAIATAAAAAIPKIRETPQADEYQRRGLGMSKNPGAVQDKVLKVQEQIRDILKSAQIQGKELVWT